MEKISILLAIYAVCSSFVGCASFQPKSGTAIVVLSRNQPPEPLGGENALKLKFDVVSFTQVEAWKVLDSLWKQTTLVKKNNIFVARYMTRSDADFNKIPLKAAWVPVTFTLRNTTLKVVFDELCRQTGWTYYFDEKRYEFVFDMNSAYKDQMVNGKIPDYIYRRGW